LLLKEDLTAQVDGSTATFTIPNTPVTTANGQITNSTEQITVYLNGKEVPVRELNGESGVFTLFTIPPNQPSTFLEVSYHYDLRDSLISLQDLSDQVDGVTVEFYVHDLYIVDGTNRGQITTDPGDVTVLVAGNEVEVQALDGFTGKITL
jgi:hypothetical protein